MQSQLKTEQSSRGSLIESELNARKAGKLIKEIQELLKPHGVNAEAVANAFGEILFETSIDRMRESMEEFRAYMLGTVIWKIFGEGSSPWIYPQTRSGNEVPVDLLVAAHLAWKNAMSLAARQGVDSAAAAEAFVNAAHATADRIVREELHKKAEAQLALWLDADAKVSQRQQWTHPGRMFTAAGAGKIRANIEFWNRQCKRLARGGPRVRGAIVL